MSIVTQFLILKLIEPKINESLIQLDGLENYDVGEDEYNNEIACCINYVKFSQLSAFEEGSHRAKLEHICEHLFAKHKKLKYIFPNDKIYPSMNKSSYTDIFRLFNSTDFDKITVDIVGHGYQMVMKTVYRGRDFGQYFTLSKIKDVLISQIQPKLDAHGKFPSIYDPAAGTCGILVSVLQYLQTHGEINWDYATTKGFGASEIVPDTHQIGHSNMFISSSHLFENIKQLFRQPTWHSRESVSPCSSRSTMAWCKRRSDLPARPWLPALTPCASFKNGLDLGIDCLGWELALCGDGLYGLAFGHERKQGLLGLLEIAARVTGRTRASTMAGSRAVPPVATARMASTSWLPSAMWSFSR